MDWTAPATIKQQIQRYWDSGRLLSADPGNQLTFPLKLRFKRPDASALSERFDEVRKWIRELEDGSKAKLGFGYEIEWREIHHRSLGSNRVPAGILLPAEEDALRLIGKKREAVQFRNLAEESIKRFPALAEWFSRRPFTALKYAEDWDRILAVLTWFRDRSGAGLYLRQLDIPGVDTKFIQARTGLLSELLDRILPDAGSATSSVRIKNFEQRYGLISKPFLIRFRILDERLAIQGLSDLSVPLAQFAQLDLPVEQVFITENEVNGLVFPDIPASLVIFGLGYGVQLLGEAGWLKGKRLYYWGDIDTHGFAILDRLRADFPHVRSFLMDHETLTAHRELWVTDEDRYEGILTRLTPSETALFDDLKHGSLGDRVRLEQERISFGWFKSALQMERFLKPCLSADG
ncbi:MAG TPA: Wadjet anti-phage system protein JetD domain-containing protein [Bryobacteraceae bacterium]